MCVMRDPRRTRMHRPVALLLGSCLAATLLAVTATPAPAAEVSDARKLFNTGKYEECIELCATGTRGRQWDESWWLLKIRAELATGQYPQALETLEAAIDRFDASARLRLLGVEVYRLNNKPD